jgi:hypothetical protein
VQLVASCVGTNASNNTNIQHEHILSSEAIQGDLVAERFQCDDTDLNELYSRHENRFGISLNFVSIATNYESSTNTHTHTHIHTHTHSLTHFFYFLD